MERKPYLVCWIWQESDGGMFIERVAMTPREKKNLKARLQVLQEGGDIAELYVGNEQPVPTPYNTFLTHYPFLTGVADEKSNRDHNRHHVPDPLLRQEN